MNYSAEDAARDYPPLIRRKQVHEMGCKFGLTRWACRKLTEGRGAVLKPRKLAKQKYGYFLRDKVIGVFGSTKAE